MIGGKFDAIAKQVVPHLIHPVFIRHNGYRLQHELHIQVTGRPLRFQANDSFAQLLVETKLLQVGLCMLVLQAGQFQQIVAQPGQPVALLVDNIQHLHTGFPVHGLDLQHTGIAFDRR
ncbi:hypothetical protein D3C85_1426350 [compost metagenome]